VPAVELPGADGRADTHAFLKTFVETHAVADAGTDARTDDGDARAHTTTVGGTHTCSIITTDDGSALVEAHPSTLLV
jgi:hypothetical protein